MKQQIPMRMVATAVLFVLGLMLLPAIVQARVLDYPSYDVDIVINQDSTVDVTETINVRFDGTQRGVQRGITIDDRGNRLFCEQSGLTCGGFEWISLLGVYDENGHPAPEGDVEAGVFEDEDSGISYFRVRWTLWPDGKIHDGSEVVTWQIKYRLLGSIGFVGDDPTKLSPVFYWNVLPEDRGGPTDEANIKITFPENVEVDINDLNVYFDYDLTYFYDFQDNVLSLNANDLSSFGNFTVEYTMPENSVNVPARLSYSSGLPWFGLGVKIDDVDLGQVGGVIESFPTGKHKVEFYYPGYESKIIDVSASPAEVIELDASLQPTPIMWLMIFVTLALNLVGLVGIPLGIFWVYLRWRHRGRDINLPPTFIPLFHPPKGVQPYLLGSLRDEKVDQVDVTGTIIDLAYRGFIKIKEIKKGSNYELTKREGKDTLNEFEEQLMDDIFGSQEVRETKELGKRFAPRYPSLVRMAYKEMVERGWFKRSPEQTRGLYAGAGVAVTVLGVITAIGAGLVGSAITGIIGPALIGIAILCVGIALLVAAAFMPAKTAAGSKVYAEVEGFYMYMYRAERYRVQGLDPEEFEKYLSYAIVFGIENEWAKKFADIYKGQPDWYEGTSRVYDAFWLSSFSRSFSNSMNSYAYHTATSGSASGGGWSGGGGGGFSGGGGGGGFSGGF